MLTVRDIPNITLRDMLIIHQMVEREYDSEIPKYPIFQVSLKYSVVLFSIPVCMVQEATRLNPRKDHLDKFLGQGAYPQIALDYGMRMWRHFLIQFFLSYCVNTLNRCTI